MAEAFQIGERPAIRSLGQKTPGPALKLLGEAPLVNALMGTRRSL